MNGKVQQISYWVTTALLAFVVFSGGVADLAQRGATVEGMLQLGYPLYFVSILGFWKVLAAFALLVPRFPRLKEWAYAGIVFEMTGAAASHIARGSGTEHVVWTLSFAALAVASWALRPPSRTLGVLVPGTMRGLVAGNRATISAAR